jgi:signal transduction histidine kinase
MEKVHVLADRHWHLDETADVMLDADPQRLTQALVQLAANAVKYTGPSSTIALGSRLESSTAPDGTAANGTVTNGTVPDGTTANGSAPLDPDTLVLWVRDTGTGIAAEDQQRIFERFGRAHPGRGHEGSGLGLAIVTAIAEAHGGTAGVESEYGHGSRFLVRIPLQPVGARL